MQLMLFAASFSSVDETCGEMFRYHYDGSPEQVSKQVAGACAMGVEGAAAIKEWLEKTAKPGDALALRYDYILLLTDIDGGTDYHMAKRTVKRQVTVDVDVPVVVPDTPPKPRKKKAKKPKTKKEAVSKAPDEW